MHSRRSTTVRGHYRNGHWVSPHRRSGTTVVDSSRKSVYRSLLPDTPQASLFTPSKPPPLPPNEKVCGRTHCPYCRADVYFVRHNNGSVWLDALGWPWPKHPCFNSPDPSWILYFRKYTRILPVVTSQDTSTTIVPEILIGVVVAVRTTNTRRLLIAFDSGDDGKFCLEVSRKKYHTEPRFCRRIEYARKNFDAIGLHCVRSYFFSGVDRRAGGHL